VTHVSLLDMRETGGGRPPKTAAISGPPASFEIGGLMFGELRDPACGARSPSITEWCRQLVIL
jgi:hypothetical protein